MKNKIIIITSNSRSGHNFIKNNIFSWLKNIYEIEYYNFENIIPETYGDAVNIWNVNDNENNLNIIIIRDYLNWLASFIPLKKVQLLNEYNDVNKNMIINNMLIEIDKYNYIFDEYFNKTNYIKNKIQINYDSFFISRHYRKKICKKINGVYNENKLNEVAHIGIYSTFDSNEFKKNAQKMKTNERYLDILNSEYHDIYIKLLLSKKEILDKYIKNLNPDINKINFINSLENINLKNNVITNSLNSEFEFKMNDFLIFLYMNNIYKMVNSSEFIHKIDKKTWESYQRGRKEYIKNTERPTYLEISDSLGYNTNYKIADFGCAANEFSKLRINDEVFPLDLYAYDDTVIECDIAKTPLDDNSMDVVVISLSLIIKNYIDILTEAYRVLKNNGILKIAEPNKTKLNIHELSKIGFKNIEKIEKKRFIYFNAIK